MRRLLTGYAVRFNRRHQRCGQLFQNRYKSVLCEEEPYLLELLRYIHLNPLRSGIVASFDELDCYPYCGHSALMGNLTREWQTTDIVLLNFGRTLREARSHYHSFVAKAISAGKRGDLSGGGLVRSSGGWDAARAESSKTGDRTRGDERILGGSDFVDQVLSDANKALDRKVRRHQVAVDLAALMGHAAALSGVRPEDVRGRGRQRALVRARSLFCYWAVEVFVNRDVLKQFNNFSDTSILDTTMLRSARLDAPGALLQRDDSRN
jgi:hypothetical protein